MSDLFATLRWRLLVGLSMMILSALVLAFAGPGIALGPAQPTESEIAQARQQREEYLAEREIRQARQTGGYDPSDPAVIRDGYPASEDARYSSSGTEPYAENPSE